jgi:ATPase family associated with various cellular activities (AAA)
MLIKETTIHAECMLAQMHWLSGRIDHLLSEDSYAELGSLCLPELVAGSNYSRYVTDNGLDEMDRVILNLAFAASFAPDMLYKLTALRSQPNLKYVVGGYFPENDSEFCPTVRTAIFLLAGKEMANRTKFSAAIHGKKRIFTCGLVHALPREKEAVFHKHEIQFNDQFMGTLLHDLSPRYDSEYGFPARLSEAKHRLKDVVKDEGVSYELFRLHRFITVMERVWKMNEEEKRTRENFIAIFTGEPGTGKSHTAEALGNEYGLPVYKVNFAQMVSKYIGETEKNLDRIFERFNKQKCILFFDEAEAIFSKRVEVGDSHDQHANNLQSFLLQRIEEFKGIIILATNVQDTKKYFDKAFQRRIRSTVVFGFPLEHERKELWDKALFKGYTFSESLVDKLSHDYQLSGGGIYNVISEALLDAIIEEKMVITFEMLEPALRDEFKKTGRILQVTTDAMALLNPHLRYGHGFEGRKNF